MALYKTYPLFYRYYYIRSGTYKVSGEFEHDGFVSVFPVQVRVTNRYDCIVSVRQFTCDILVYNDDDDDDDRDVYADGD